MKYHIVLKFLAIVLCAAFLLLTVAGGAGIAVMIEAGLYSNSPEELKAQIREQDFRQLANYTAKHYAMEKLSNCPQALIEAYMSSYYSYSDRILLGENTQWYYTICDSDGTVLATTWKAQIYGYDQYEYILEPFYPVVLAYDADGYNPSSASETEGDVTDPSQPTVPETTQPEMETTSVTAPRTEEQTPTAPGEISGYTMDKEPVYEEEFVFQDPETNLLHHYRLGVYQGPILLVKLYIPQGTYTQDLGWEWELLTLACDYRYHLIGATAAALLLFAILLVYLCCAAGHKPRREEVQPGGLNMLPLDLYGVLAGGGCFLLAAGIAWLFYNFDMDDLMWLYAAGIAAAGYAIALLVTAFLFACAAQFKMKPGYWLRHSLVGTALLLCLQLLRYLGRGLRKALGWLGDKLPGAARKTASVTAKASRTGWSGLKKVCVTLWIVGSKAIIWCWQALCKLISALMAAIRKFFRWTWRKLSRFVQLLPLTWQWLLTAFGMCFLLLFAILSRSEMLLVLAVFACTAIVLYGAHAFGALLESTRRMSQGDLDTKVDDHLLIGGFADYAKHLNDLAGVAVVAAQKQMKSERMKAELITNVSHDIKTPLTSIINYVDLLQKAKTEEEAQQYLEVLERQSLRMKKLIDDLMEMSKASTGNIAVEIVQVDAAEAVNQALGEFADKLAAAELTPVFNPLADAVYMKADGRLAWRVLSNLLGNAVKYALPGTRLYIDLTRVDGNVLISLKNISKEPLNVSSDELMERFVRGDASRNTEGSGLGLNIARSLMELQHGQLQLLIDGDLFKATMILPGA